MLLAACGDDAEMLRTMCRSFTVRAPEHLARLERASARPRRGSLARSRAQVQRPALCVFDSSRRPGGVARGSRRRNRAYDEAKIIVERLGTIVPALVRLSDGLTLETLRQAETAQPANRSGDLSS